MGWARKWVNVKFVPNNRRVARKIGILGGFISLRFFFFSSS